MMSRIPWAISGVLTIGLVTTMLDNRRLRTALTQRQSEPAAAAPEVDSLGLHGSLAQPAAQRPSDPDDDATAAATPDRSSRSSDDEDDRSGIAALVSDRLDEAVEARISERRVERFEQMRDRTTERVDDFADDAALDDAERETMLDIIDGAMEDMVTIWQDHQDEADRETARDAMRTDFIEVRDEMETALVELLGEEDAAAFQQELRGPLGWQR